MTPQAARHRRAQPRTIQPTAARRDTPRCCGPTVRVVCACGNAYACESCGAELHAQHPEEA